jgi:hypothetical protein
MAGGYVQFASRTIDSNYENYKIVAEHLFEVLNDAPRKGDWRVRFEIGDVCYKLEGVELETVSLWVWFDIGAATADRAEKGRERFLQRLEGALFG